MIEFGVFDHFFDMTVYLNVRDVHGRGAVALESICKFCFDSFTGHCSMLEGVNLFALGCCRSIGFKSFLGSRLGYSTLSEVLMLYVLTLDSS